MKYYKIKRFSIIAMTAVLLNSFTGCDAEETTTTQDPGQNAPRKIVRAPDGEEKVPLRAAPIDDITPPRDTPEEDNDSLAQATPEEDNQLPLPIPEAPPLPPPAAANMFNFHQLELLGQLAIKDAKEVAITDISAIGSNGNRSLIYFGSSSRNNKLFSMNPAFNPPVVTELGTSTGAAHDNAGHYKANEPGGFGFFGFGGSGSRDQTQIRSIVAGPGDSAVVSLTGLTKTYDGKWLIGLGAKAAQGGVMQLNANTVSGLWGNINASLNAGVDSQEISAIATVGDNWIAFPNDITGTSAYRNFDLAAEPLAKANRSLKDNESRIVTAALGAGDSLYRGFSDGRVGRLNNALTSLGDASAGEDLLAEDKDLKINPEVSNNQISALAVVGDRLLIGMRTAEDPKTGPKTGGVAVVNLNNNSVVPPPAGHQGLSIKQISVSHNGDTAMITTDGQGLMYFSDGKFTKIDGRSLPGLALGTASESQPFEVNSGNITFNPENAKVGAVNIGTSWFIATDNAGIFEFKDTVLQKAK